jgi:hypothetical protein
MRVPVIILSLMLPANISGIMFSPSPATAKSQSSLFIRSNLCDFTRALMWGPPRIILAFLYADVETTQKMRDEERIIKDTLQKEIR